VNKGRFKYIYYKFMEKEIGKVTHFFGKISVAVIELSDELRVGDVIKIVGRGKEFTQTVSSMQIEHKNIEVAKAGQTIGLKVDQPVKEGDIVYKVEQ
jgi:putative protease